MASKTWAYELVKVQVLGKRYYSTTVAHGHYAKQAVVLHINWVMQESML